MTKQPGSAADTSGVPPWNLPYAWEPGGPVRRVAARSPYAPRDAFPRGAWAVPADHPDRDRYAFVAPLIATVLCGPLGVLDGLCVMFSPFATDSCTAHGCHALYRSLLTAPCLLVVAWVAFGLAWGIPWRRRYRAWRIVLSATAPLFAVAALLMYLHLPEAT